MFDKGKEIYMSTCTSCHGIDGSANTEIQLVVNPRDLTKSLLNENQRFQIIKMGTHYWGSYADIMPSFGSVFDDKEIRSVAHYITKHFNPNVEKRTEELYALSDTIPISRQEKMFKRGQKIYKRNCFWCHGKDGKGDGSATRNPEKSIYPYNLGKTLLTKKQMFLYVKYGGKYWGSYKSDMPSWSKKYDDYTIKSVILYIDETFRKKR